MQNTHPIYCIVENFRERKLSRISRFCGYTLKFSPQNLGRGVLWCGKSEQSAKVFSAEIVLFPNSQKFLPWKFPAIRYKHHLISLIQPYPIQYTLLHQPTTLHERTFHASTVFILWCFWTTGFRYRQVIWKLVLHRWVWFGFHGFLFTDHVDLLSHNSHKLSIPNHTLLWDENVLHSIGIGNRSEVHAPCGYPRNRSVSLQRQHPSVPRKYPLWCSVRTGWAVSHFLSKTVLSVIR